MLRCSSRAAASPVPPYPKPALLRWAAAPLDLGISPSGRNDLQATNKLGLFFFRVEVTSQSPFAVFQERSNRLQRQEGRNRQASPFGSLLPPRLIGRAARAPQTIYCSLQDHRRKARTVRARHMSAPQTASCTARSRRCSSYLFSPAPPNPPNPRPPASTPPPRPPAPYDSIRTREEIKAEALLSEMDLLKRRCIHFRF